MRHLNRKPCFGSTVPDCRKREKFRWKEKGNRRPILCETFQLSPFQLTDDQKKPHEKNICVESSLPLGPDNFPKDGVHIVPVVF